MLAKIRHVLSFFYAVEDSSSAGKNIAGDMLAKVWFEALSLTSTEESAHPHKLEKFSKKITMPGVDKIMVTLDRRSDVMEGCVLKVSGGGYTLAFKGGEDADAFTKPIVFMASEIEVVFECSVEPHAQNTEHWGWAISTEGVGNAAFESVTVKTKLDDNVSTLIPLLSSQQTEQSTVDEGTVATTEVQSEEQASALVAAASDSQREEALKAANLEITEAVLEKAFEIGRLVDSNEIHLPFESERTIEIKGSILPREAASEKLVYVVTLMYSIGEDNKTVRTALAPDSTFKHVISKCTSVAYAIHAVFEMKLKEIFVNIVPQVAQPDASATALVPEVEDDVSTVVDWSCPVCTYVNAVGVAECEMCGNAAATATTAGRAEIQVSWFCRSCTLINNGTSTRCAACDTEREAPPATATATAAVDATEDSSSDDDDSASESEASISSAPTLVDTPEIIHRRSSRESILRLMLGNVIRARDSISFTADSCAEGNSEKADYVSITLRGSYSPEQKFEIRLDRAMAEHRPVPALLQQSMRRWTAPLDNVLLEYINSQNMGTEDQPLHRPSLSKQTFQLYHSAGLDKMSSWDVSSRMHVFRAFNATIKDLLPSLNLLNQDPRSLGALIRKYNRYIFLNVKQPLLDAALEESQVNSGSGLPATLVLNNFKSITSKEKPEADLIKCLNCFVQAFQQLQKKEVKVFKHIFSSDRVFQITFEGESGIDAGGVFREGMSRIMEDLFADTFSLLKLCPNGKHGVHINTEKYVPNPAYSGVVEMQMFEFIGRIMGSSLRAKMCLPFEFPSVVWKLLAGDELIEEDFLAFDAISYKQLVAMRDCDTNDTIDNETFQEKFDHHNFTCLGCDGVEHELISGGKDITVTFDNRLDYYQRSIAFRLHEFDAQTAAIKKGLEDVVPINLLQLFSWQQLEILVAGNPAFDITLWKSKTDSEQISNKTANLFWKVMESLTPKEQSGFVRFAWGRSRLPPERQWTTKMRLTNAGRVALPVSHTCFFSVEMPAYETEAEMRKGLLTVIHFGIGGILNG
jgi:rubredoxin